jgi:beta-lactamase class A
MVASAFGLDPLAHAPSDRNIAIWNKTGSDPGVRADVGTVRRSGGWLSYAVIANWNAAAPDLADGVLAGMHDIGALLRTAIENDAR